MLFTRCPDCETTFRITAEALRKADGQVRCGRCACVFNGYNELRRRERRKAASAPDAPAPLAAPDRENAPSGNPATNGSGTGAEAVAAALPSGAESQGAAEAAPVRPAAQSAAPAGLESPSDRPTVPHKPTDGLPSYSPTAAAPKATANEKDPSVDEFSLAGVIAELEASAAPDTDRLGASSSALGLEPARERSSPDAGTADTAGALSTPTWVILDETRPQRVSRRVWMIGCAAAAALLVLQVVHHYRSELVVLDVVGPIVRQAYALLGSEIAPDWNIAQYEIEVDWDAVAQPDADGQGNLKIAARIRNEGPRALPLPHVQVQLKDRWESTIGSRVFTPAEYLPPGRAVDYVMKQGQSALAELDILDPGPQAYGFELDVCVDAANGTLRCAADEVFR